MEPVPSTPNTPTSGGTVPPERRSVVVGALWMIGLSIALFFLPLVNGFIGGLVGGYKVGTVGRALLAALLPAAFVALALWVLFAVFQAPVVGLLAGAAVGIWILLSDVGIFLGAALGGAIGPDPV